MSDFGSHVAVYRTDRKNATKDDERRVRTAARSLQFTSVDRIGPFDEFDLRFCGSHRADGTQGVAVILSSYYVGEDERNDGLEPEVIMAREAPVAEQFADELERLLGSEFEVAPYSGDH